MSRPDYHEHEEFINRSQKLAEIRELGVEPYPHKFTPTHFSHELHKQWTGHEVGNSEDAELGKTGEVCLAGRLVLFRAMGKNAFGQLQDEHGRIQIMFNRDHSSVDGYNPESSSVAQAPSPIKFIEKKLDLGDIIGVKGHLFRTGKGELTIFVKTVTLLCKTLLPLPDKHSGLSDKEQRYRKRWLDLISNADVQKRFRTRSHILRIVRKHFEEQSFLEVETPVIQSIYGGAEAAPFETKLNALNQHMFLRISLEISLKKLLVGGMGRVFELSKVFRNEGIDRTHNPEFTMLEAYASYWDYNDMMHCVETLYEKIALELFGDTKIPYIRNEGEEPVMIDMKAPWARLTVKDAIKKFGKIDVDQMSDDELREKLSTFPKISAEDAKKLPRGLLIAKLFEETAEEHLVQPHHIIDHPIETTPLCKLHRDPKEKEQGIVERFESFIVGSEACNAYSELNDPQIQRRLLEDQAEKLEKGDDEANPLDEEFIEAICQGMPPAGGVGIGIDRLVMVFTQALSIRDVLYFPWMKPLDHGNHPSEEEASATEKACT